MNEQNLKITELNQIRAIEHFKSVISMAELSLKTSILINGGATVSILTFLGNTKVNFNLLVTVSLIIFALGVFFGGVSTLLGYMAQNEYMRRINNKEERNPINIYKSAAIVSCFLAYVAFLVGIIFVFAGFQCISI